MDGIAIVVNSKNPLTSITKEQVQAIYAGEITNWKDVGGGDAPIMLVSKEEGRSTLDLFLKYFELEAKEMGEGKSAVMVHRVKGEKDSNLPYSQATSRMIGPNREALAAIATKPNAIAYVSIGTAQEMVRKGGKIRCLNLDEVPATVANVANHSYPLRRPLNVVTNGEATGIVKEFVDYLMSAEGQLIVTKLEFIGLQSDEEAKLTDASDK